MIDSLISSALNRENTIENQLFNPFFYCLTNKNDEENFIRLLNNSSAIVVFNEIQSQLEELIKLRHPKLKFTPEQLQQKIEEHLNGVELNKYGVWVHYPWLNKVVHLLDEDEFIEVRTNRNQYKITPEEENVLATKTIGIIGLSVGKAIALTIALERICGKLIIADFDTIELSNLNRIQTGVQNFGIKKTVVVAREIAEIDPFLKVTCLHEGLTEENMNEFFFPNNRKMDVCIEVCDGLSTKIFARQKAKEFGIPVVMNSSDRGTTDIERFDLNPELPILHGLIDHLDITLVKQAKTNEEKVPYLLPMLGVETSSERLKASMLEIEQTITTWPQLASGVVMGGGICTDVCRRILLNQFSDSGRYFVDVEDSIQNDNYKIYTEKPLNIQPSLTDEQMLGIIKESDSQPKEYQIDLDADTVKRLVDAGSKAPSGANCQSWKWMYHNKSLYLFFDDIFRPELLDCKRTTMITGLGAATENVVLKTHELGYEVITETVNINDESKLITTFRFFKKQHNLNTSNFEPHVCDYLATAIDYRVSNRDIVESEPISNDRLEKLKKITQTISGANLHIISDPKKLKKLADITGKMDRIRYTSPGGHSDFRGEARWTIEDALKTRTGISFQETMDLTPTEFAGFYVSKDWRVVQHLAKWKLGTAYEKIQRKWINGSAAVGLITMPSFSTNNFFEGGRALERMWLATNHDKIECHPPSLSTLIFNSVVYEEKDVLPKDMQVEAILLLKEFEELFDIDPTAGKVLLFRFFIGIPPKYRALRYNINQILSFGNK